MMMLLLMTLLLVLSLKQTPRPDPMTAVVQMMMVKQVPSVCHYQIEVKRYVMSILDPGIINKRQSNAQN
jgi:hypothetical protein